MKIKTAELEGAALDWAAVIAISGSPVMFEIYGANFLGRSIRREVEKGRIRPSTDWRQGGPLIDRYLIDFRTQSKGCKVLAWAAHEPVPSEGPSHLIAAMRAIVASELGNEVDVPDELA